MPYQTPARTNQACPTLLQCSHSGQKCGPLACAVHWLVLSITILSIVSITAFSHVYRTFLEAATITQLPQCLFLENSFENNYKLTATTFHYNLLNAHQTKAIRTRHESKHLSNPCFHIESELLLAPFFYMPILKLIWILINELTL